MAKFCENCGKQLEEGEICSCNESTVNQQQQNQKVSPNRIGEYFKRLFKVALNSVKTPSEMLGKYVGVSDFEVGIGFIVIQAIVISLFMVVLFHKFYSMINGLGYIGSILGLGSDNSHLVKVFFLTIIVSLIISFAFAGVLLFISKVVFKQNIDIKKAICVAGAKCLAAAPFTIIAILITFINISIGFFILSLGTILGYYFVLVALKSVVNLDSNKLIYSLFFTYAIMIIVTAIVIRIALPEYVPSNLNSLF